MKAIVFEEFKGAIRLMDVPSPRPKTHGVVVRVRATGLCLSDWHGWQGHDSDIKLPHVPGHELVGEIVECGKEVRKFSIGDRVTVPFVAGCGKCPQCDTGNHQVCDNQSQAGFTHWGSFAEFVQLDYADVNLVHVPEYISDETACLLGCRFITSFRALVAQGRLKAGEFVAVHGCGGVGLSAILIAQALGAQVIAIDINDHALERARNFGVTSLINSRTTEDVVEYIKEISNGGVHVSLDALGHPETCFNSIANLRKRGRHIQVGLMTNDHKHPEIPMDKVIANELEILGSHGMQAHKYPEVFELIQSDRLKLELLLGKTIALEEAVFFLPKMDAFKSDGVTVINAF